MRARVLVVLPISTAVKLRVVELVCLSGGWPCLVVRRSWFSLSSEERAVLRSRASSRTAAHAEVVRARIVLLAADGAPNVDIATRLGCASMWCRGGASGSASRVSWSEGSSPVGAAAHVRARGGGRGQGDGV